MSLEHVASLHAMRTIIACALVSQRAAELWTEQQAACAHVGELKAAAACKQAQVPVVH